MDDFPQSWTPVLYRGPCGSELALFTHSPHAQLATAKLNKS